MIMKMTMVSMETVYKFDIVATKDAVRDAFDNAGLILAFKGKRPESSER